MTREEARNILRNKSCVDCVNRCAYPLENQEGYCEYADAISMAIEALKADVPDMNVGKWIPCSERLPAENGNYLVTAIWKGKLEVDMDYFQFGCMWDDYRDNVIAWQKLPEPYKEEE